MPHNNNNASHIVYYTQVFHNITILLVDSWAYFIHSRWKSLKKDKATQQCSEAAVECNLGFHELTAEPEPDQWDLGSLLGSWTECSECVRSFHTLTHSHMVCESGLSACLRTKKTSHMCVCFFSFASKPNRSPSSVNLTTSYVSPLCITIKKI